MPRVTVCLEHTIGTEEAVRRIKAHYDAMKSRHQSQLKILEETWQGDTLDLRFQTFGVTIRSQLIVEAAKVTVQVELPLMAMMFKGKVEEQIRNDLGRLLSI